MRILHHQLIFSEIYSLANNLMNRTRFVKNVLKMLSKMNMVYVKVALIIARNAQREVHVTNVKKDTIGIQMLIK